MTAPLNINAGGDIQQAVNWNSGDLGECVSKGTINKWAKWKPERSPKVGTLTLDDRRDNSFGLAITPCGPHGDISSFVSGFASQWAYLRPRGVDGARDERYRMTDFINPSSPSGAGYNSRAASFLNVNDRLLPSSYIVGNGGAGCRFRMGWTPAAQLPAGSLLPGDLVLGGSLGDTAFSDMYFCLLFTDGDSHRIVTSGAPVSSDAYGSELVIGEADGSLAGLTTGVTYTVYPCLSLAQHASLTAFGNQDALVALPVSPFTFRAARMSSVQNLAISGARAVHGLRATLDVSFTVSMAATGGAATSIHDAVYRISAASMNDLGELTAGDLIGSGQVGSLDSVTPTRRTVSASYRTSIPEWVHIRVSRSGADDVEAETYVAVTLDEEGIEPIS